MDRKISRNQLGDKTKSKFTIVNNSIEKIFSLALILLIFIIVLSTFMQVIFRYLFNTPLIWPEEISRLCYIWISFLGMSILVRKGTLLGVDTLVELLNNRLKKILFYFNGLVMIVIIALFSTLGYEMLGRIQGQSMPATGLSTQWMYIIVPISGLVAILFIIESLIKKYNQVCEGEK